MLLRQFLAGEKRKKNGKEPLSSSSSSSCSPSSRPRAYEHTHTRILCVRTLILATSLNGGSGRETPSVNNHQLDSSFLFTFSLSLLLALSLLPLSPSLLGHLRKASLDSWLIRRTEQQSPWSEMCVCVCDWSILPLERERFQVGCIEY